MNDLKITNHRSGEIKFEKMMDTKRSRCYVFLQNSEAKYVIIGTRRHRDKS
jgi:hypothetical protein